MNNSDKMARSLQENRRFVNVGLITGIILMFLTFAMGMYVLPAGKASNFPSELEKLVYTIKWQSLSVLMLLFGIQRVAEKRRSTTAIDPVHGKSEDLLFVETRYVQNTVEQLILSLTGQVVLSLYVSAAVLTRSIPTLVALFVTGRVLFYIGYKLDPLKRALGFAMTFIPSVLVHMYCLFCFFWYK